MCDRAVKPAKLNATLCNGSWQRMVLRFVAQVCRRGCGRPAALLSGHQKSAGPRTNRVAPRYKSKSTLSHFVVLLSRAFAQAVCRQHISAYVALLINNRAPFQSHGRQVDTEMIGDFTVIFSIHHHDIGLLPGLERAHPISPAHGM